MAAKPQTIDDYLLALNDDQRLALEKIRQTIHAIAPRVEEYIGYGLAAFRLEGRPLVALGATEKHCGFYLMSSSTVAAHTAELQGYDTSTGTIRFSPNKPLPTTLLRKLIKARIVENSERGRARDVSKKPRHKD